MTLKANAVRCLRHRSNRLPGRLKENTTWGHHVADDVLNVHTRIHVRTQTNYWTRINGQSPNIYLLYCFCQSTILTLRPIRHQGQKWLEINDREFPRTEIFFFGNSFPPDHGQTKIFRAQNDLNGMIEHNRFVVKRDNKRKIKWFFDNKINISQQRYQAIYTQINLMSYLKIEINIRRIKSIYKVILSAF